MVKDSKKSLKRDTDAEDTIGKVVKGTSPLWIRIVILILRGWFYVYDCLNYIPYELFNPPTAKLRMSERVKARPIKGLDSPWRNVDGSLFYDFPGKDTLDKLFSHVASLYGDSDCLGTRELLEVHQQKQLNGRIFEKWTLGEYVWESYNEVHQKVGYIAAGLKNLTDNKEVMAVIFSETRADWMVTALSCFRANIPIVTVYATLGREAITHAINETSPTIIFTSPDLFEKVVKVSENCPSLEIMIYFSPISSAKSDPNLSLAKKNFKHVLSLKELETLESEPLMKSASVTDSLAVIMYTSGTTGPPKGVMLTNGNIVSAIAGLGAGVSIVSTSDTYIGYLPLAHIFELGAELCVLVNGCRIGYSSPFTLHDRGTKIKEGTHGDCWALQPTLLAAVPAIMDRIFKAVSDEVAASPRLMQELFKLNYERKRERYQEGYCSPFLDRIVFKRIRQLLGGQIRGVVSGGAPLNPETQRFMNICMCCPVIQGYGLTETCATAAIADINDLSTGTVGPPVRCGEILLREWKEGGYTPLNDPPQGEILIGGRAVSIGYWKNPEKTAEDFLIIDGVRYFASGDIGEMREDGSLMIIDRKKDLVKLMHGEYISLAKVETALLTCPLIDNICVYGNPLSTYLVALIVPNTKHLQKIAEQIGVEYSNSFQDARLNAEVKKTIMEHAKENNLSKFEIPESYHLCEEVWTSESGLLTEAMKIKRRAIKEKYENEINDMYRSSKRSGDTKNQKKS